MNPRMNYSREGLLNTMHWEGCELEAYPDPGTKDDPIKKGFPWTIGYGHTKGVYPGMKCTQAQAEAWLREDIKWAQDTVNDMVNVSLDQSQFDALVDFVFNVGRPQFATSTLLRKLNQGLYSEIDAELRKWVFANGKKLGGLIARREKGTEMFDDEPPTSA